MLSRPKCDNAILVSDVPTYISAGTMITKFGWRIDFGAYHKDKYDFSEDTRVFENVSANGNVACGAIKHWLKYSS